MKNDPTQNSVKRICAKIKAERERQGISQQKLSELAGVSRTGLRHIESLETSPTLYSILKLTKALGLKPTDLFTE